MNRPNFDSTSREAVIKVKQVHKTKKYRKTITQRLARKTQISGS